MVYTYIKIMYFEIFSLLLCYIGIFFPLPTNGDVVAFENVNRTKQFADEEAEFGTSIGKDGLMGFLSLANPIDACSPMNERSSNSSTFGNITLNAFVLISRGGCDFATKVLYAQEAKFDAVIVHNVGSDELIKMGSIGDKVKLIVIPSVFVGASDGALLETNYLHTNGVYPYINLESGGMSFSLPYYLLPFCIVFGVCFAVMLGYFIVRHITDRRRQRRSRLSKQRLKQLPVKKFAQGDEYDACAICLEDYVEGEKLRILPCKHAFHCECVDPWLTSNKRVCPLCKSNVLSDDEASDSDTEDNVDADTNEATPLLRNATAASPNAPRFATGLGFQNPFTRNYSTSPSEASAGPSHASHSPTRSNETCESEEVLDTPPTKRGAPAAFSSSLIVLADVSPSTPGLSSSMFSCQSSEDFSCRSDDESGLNVRVSVPGQADISTHSRTYDDAPSL